MKVRRRKTGPTLFFIFLTPTAYYLFMSTLQIDDSPLGPVAVISQGASWGFESKSGAFRSANTEIRNALQRDDAPCRGGSGEAPR